MSSTQKQPPGSESLSGQGKSRTATLTSEASLMSDPKTSPVTRNATSSPASAAGRSPSSSPEFRQLDLWGQEAAPASHSATPAKDSAQPILATSGPISSASLFSVARSASNGLSRSLANRLQARLRWRGSMEYSLTWKERATPAGRQICALRASAHPKSGSGSTGWPTPRAEDSESTGAHRGVPDTLTSASRLCGWPTPTLPSGGQTIPEGTSSTGQTPDGKKVTFNLEQTAKLAGWPTPMAGSPGTENYNPAGSTDSSRKTVELAGWTSPIASEARQGFQDRTRGMKGSQESLTTQAIIQCPERERERETVWLVQSRKPGLEGHSGHEHDGHEPRWVKAHSARSAAEAGPVDFWSRCQLIPCTDGKTRRIEPESFEMVDGLPHVVGTDRVEGVAELEKEINDHAASTKSRPGEALSLLWHSLVEETLRGDTGGLRSISSPPILLSFLRELSNQGWAFSESVLRASEETKEALVRSLWWEKPASRSSHQRGLEGQCADKSANPVCVLSSILARHAQAPWGEAVAAYATGSFPLAAGVKQRVGLLRGYGNAIVPQVAAEFIQAVNEALT